MPNLTKKCEKCKVNKGKLRSVPRGRILCQSCYVRINYPEKFEWDRRIL